MLSLGMLLLAAGCAIPAPVQYQQPYRPPPPIVREHPKKIPPTLDQRLGDIGAQVDALRQKAIDRERR